MDSSSVEQERLLAVIATQKQHISELKQQLQETLVSCQAKRMKPLLDRQSQHMSSMRAQFLREPTHSIHMGTANVAGAPAARAAT